MVKYVSQENHKHNIMEKVSRSHKTIDNHNRKFSKIMYVKSSKLNALEFSDRVYARGQNARNIIADQKVVKSTLC